MRLESSIRQTTSRPMLDEASDGSEDSTFLVSKIASVERAGRGTVRRTRSKSTREIVEDMAARTKRIVEEQARRSLSPGYRSSSPPKFSSVSSSRSTRKSGRSGTPYKSGRLGSANIESVAEETEKAVSSTRSSSPSKSSLRPAESSKYSSRSSVPIKTRTSSPSKSSSSCDPTSTTSSSRSSSPSKSSLKSSIRTSSPSKSSSRTSGHSESRRSSIPSKSSRSGNPSKSIRSPVSSSAEAAPLKSSLVKPEPCGLDDDSKAKRSEARVRRVSRRASTMGPEAFTKTSTSDGAVRRVIRRKSVDSVNALDMFATKGAQVVEGDYHKKVIRVKIVKKPSAVANDSKQKVRKSVSFDESPPVFKENHLYCEEEVPGMWFDRYDVESFKANLERAIEEITGDEKKSEIWRKSLSRAYDMSCTVDNEDSFLDTRSATFKLVKYRLKDVFADTMELIGVEHLLADEIRSDANRRRARVLDLIDKLKAERDRRKRLGTELEGDKIADLEKLNQEALEASRASRFFAHGLALAQHAATEEQVGTEEQA